MTFKSYLGEWHFHRLEIKTLRFSSFVVYFKILLLVWIFFNVIQTSVWKPSIWSFSLGFKFLKKKLIVNSWTSIRTLWNYQSFEFFNSILLYKLVVLTKFYFVFWFLSNWKIEAAILFYLFKKWTFWFFLLRISNRCSLIKIDIWKLLNHILFVSIILFHSFLFWSINLSFLRR